MRVNSSCCYLPNPRIAVFRMYFFRAAPRLIAHAIWVSVFLSSLSPGLYSGGHTHFIKRSHARAWRLFQNPGPLPVLPRSSQVYRWFHFSRKSLNDREYIIELRPMAWWTTINAVETLLRNHCKFSFVWRRTVLFWLKKTIFEKEKRERQKKANIAEILF